MLVAKVTRQSALECWKQLSNPTPMGQNILLQPNPPSYLQPEGVRCEHCRHAWDTFNKDTSRHAYNIKDFLATSAVRRVITDQSEDSLNTFGAFISLTSLYNYKCGIYGTLSSVNCHIHLLLMSFSWLFRGEIIKTGVQTPMPDTLINLGHNGRNRGFQWEHRSVLEKMIALPASSTG